MNAEPYKTPLSEKLYGLTVICFVVFAVLLTDYSPKLFFAFLFYHFMKWSSELAVEQKRREDKEKTTLNRQEVG